ncbi:CoF synthetase [Postechiella marina]
MHSIEHITFYKTYNAAKRLEDFPVINKNIINANYNHFISKTPHNEGTRIVSTSGSTGTPLKIIQNKNKILRNTADTIYFSELAGYKVGYKLLFLRHWNPIYRKSKLINWLQNTTPIEVVNMNDNDINNLLKAIEKDKSKKAWLGFPSGFEQICKYLDKTKSAPIKANIASIIGIAEGVNTYTKSRMQYYFNTPMVSRYSNMENGIIAQQMKNSTHFVINWASFFVEILKIDSDKPAELNEYGRIVITDLFNYATPMIRYDTGDIGIMDYSASPPFLKHIEGRKTDVIYNTKGNITSPFMMTSVINFIGIKQIQLIQEGLKTYTIKLNCSQQFDKQEDLILFFKSALGQDAEITIKYTKGIPLLNSGKRKMTLNKLIS